MLVTCVVLALCHLKMHQHQQWTNTPPTAAVPWRQEACLSLGEPQWSWSLVVPIGTFALMMMMMMMMMAMIYTYFLHNLFNHFSCILILKMTKALPSKGRPWPRNDDNDQGFLQPLSWQPGPGVDRSFCHLSSGKPPCHSLNKENSDAAWNWLPSRKDCN